ncbi:TRAP transporter small permease [Pontibaca salina]|uniref:TRAP transporter small permease protein n=1 Tax=Pontibaca salina TaxID=2795731 RepID=A0A934HQT3_9RHOB|nr:TRAP transporter small permease [Pontibaca salina]MBI6628493.1 TRAP transporter small permease [Pontibaca salina]
MRSFERALVGLNRWAVIGMLAAMALVVGTNVALRYTTNASLPWADEVARYLMIWLTFIGAGLALRTGGHVAITNLQDAIPTRAQIVLRSLIVLTLLAFFLFMIWAGQDYMTRMQFQKSPALRLPFNYVYAAMPIGFALLAVHLLLIARQFITAGTYRDAPSGAAQTEAASG